ncbi:MAG: YIP1 family protein, partial [Kitasatospora sp.]|nr:YIP1 family protein [Kitasatospora sp.]
MCRLSDRPGTFDYVAGFRSGRGRDSRGTQNQGQHPPYGQQPYGGGHQGAPRYGGPPPRQQWGGGGGHGQPEYYREPDPYYSDNPGHTQPYGVGMSPDQYGGQGYDQGYDQGYGDQGYGRPAPPSGPRLHWKDLLKGIVFHPGRTFWQMRDHKMWGPALIVTFLYGLLAVFGLDQARHDVLNSTLSSSIPYVIATGVAVAVSFLILGAVTHTLARQLGGDGAWEPTVGLSMLIASITDAPRLVFAMFLGGENSLVQLLGWITWLAAAALLTSMVSKSHDLPWPKALAASAIQLLAL